MKKWSILLVLFALLLAACQSSGANAEGKSTNEVAKITPSPGKAVLDVSVDKNTPDPNQVVIVFQRSGGIAGVNDQWTIYAGGKIAKENGDTRTVSADQVTELLSAVDTAGFFDMKSPSGIGSVGKCKDCFTYQLTVFWNGQKNTISFQEGDKLPDGLSELIQQINALVNPATQ